MKIICDSCGLLADGKEGPHTNCFMTPAGTWRRRASHDSVSQPEHYTSHPSGIECIAVTEHMNFNLGNAIKYIWRAGLKDTEYHIEDLRKAAWYVAREISRLERTAPKAPEASPQTPTPAPKVYTGPERVSGEEYAKFLGKCADCSADSAGQPLCAKCNHRHALQGRPL